MANKPGNCCRSSKGRKNSNKKTSGGFWLEMVHAGMGWERLVALSNQLLNNRNYQQTRSSPGVNTCYLVIGWKTMYVYYNNNCMYMFGPAAACSMCCFSVWHSQQQATTNFMKPSNLRLLVDVFCAFFCTRCRSKVNFVSSNKYDIGVFCIIKLAKVSTRYSKVEKIHDIWNIREGFVHVKTEDVQQ